MNIMLPRFLVFVVIAGLVVMSCSKNNPTTPDDDPIVEIKFDSVETIKATIDGSSYSVTDSNDINAIVSAAAAGKLSVTISAISAGTVFTMSSVISDTGKGEYQLGVGNSTLGIVQAGVSYTTMNGSTATMYVDKVDTAQRRIKGRFSGTVKSSANVSKTVADGTFEVKW